MSVKEDTGQKAFLARINLRCSMNRAPELLCIAPASLARRTVLIALHFIDVRKKEQA